MDSAQKQFLRELVAHNTKQSVRKAVPTRYPTAPRKRPASSVSFEPSKPKRKATPGSVL